MRQQEDQIYAMQDYLAQYQQMLCEARRENAQLRCQLAQQQPCPSAPSGAARGPAPWKPERAKGPAMGAPAAPSAPEAEPAPPEVPPLEETSQRPAASPQTSPAPTSRPPDGQSPSAPEPPPTRSAPAAPPSTESAPAADPASDGEPPLFVVPAVEPGADESAVEFRTPSAAGPPQTVWLDGEVIPGNDHAGARLLVDVEPLSADGGPATFAGTLSLMVLDPGDQQGDRSLARWDFTPDQLRQAAEPVSGGRAMRLRLQLPADVTVRRPVELWARLVDDEAGKLLTHVGVDLGQPQHFSSIHRRPSADGQLAATTDDRALLQSRTLAQRPGWSQWRIARPGESNLLAERTGRAEGHWQAAAEPAPAAAVGLPSLPANMAPVEDLPELPPAEQVPLPTWSPTR
jgi:hypothetical protein